MNYTKRQQCLCVCVCVCVCVCASVYECVQTFLEENANIFCFMLFHLRRFLVPLHGK